MRRKSLFFMAAGLGVALVLSLGIGSAGAYFTDWTEANGGLPISVTPSTEPEEEYGAREKKLVVRNNGTAPVFVRARAYASCDVEIAGEGWTADENGEWWNYDQQVPAKKGGTPGATTALTMHVTFPEEAAESDEYNVIVVYESTPVQYQEDGTPYADWNFKLDAGTSTVAAEEGE